MRFITIGAAVFVTSLAGLACTPEPERQAGSARLTSGVATTTDAGSETTAKTASGFVDDIDRVTTANQDFRRVVYTAKNIQLVLMSLAPGEDIGVETHDVDQFFRVEEGSGEVTINGRRTPIAKEFAIVVPAGAEHNITNTGKGPLKVYTLYAPPQHRDKVVHHTKADAQRDREHFDGRTTE